MNHANPFRRIGVFRLLLLVSLLIHIGLSLLARRLLQAPLTQQPETTAVVMVNLASQPPAPDLTGSKQTITAAQPTTPVTQHVTAEQPVRMQSIQTLQPAAPATDSALSTPAAPRPNPAIVQHGTPASKADHGESRTPGAATPVQTAATDKAAQEATFGSATGPTFQKRVDPVYPNLARRRGKQGTVLLRLSINEAGQLTQVEILEDPGHGLSEAAVEAVRASRFSPARHNGRPVAVKATLPVRFALH